MEASQPSVVAPSPWVQRILAILSALLFASCLAMQVFVLVVMVPKFEQVWKDMGLTHVGLAGSIAAWRWPLLFLLAAAQALVILLVVRKRPYGAWLLFASAAFSVLTMALGYSFGISATRSIVQAIFSLQSK
jgi:hypothetical protein